MEHIWKVRLGTAVSETVYADYASICNGKLYFYEKKKGWFGEDAVVAVYAEWNSFARKDACI